LQIQRAGLGETHHHGFAPQPARRCRLLEAPSAPSSPIAERRRWARRREASSCARSCAFIPGPSPRTSSHTEVSLAYRAPRSRSASSVASYAPFACSVAASRPKRTSDACACNLADELHDHVRLARRHRHRCSGGRRVRRTGRDRRRGRCRESRLSIPLGHQKGDGDRGDHLRHDCDDRAAVALHRLARGRGERHARLVRGGR
jgi:hypothetical protein